MRLLICGDRYWTWAKKDIIQDAMEHQHFNLEPIEVLIEGEARGVDIIARDIAIAMGIPPLAFYANWALYGKPAGPIRNQEMLDEGKPTEVWAFHDNLNESKGTKDMVNRALKAGLPVYLFRSDGRKLLLESPKGLTENLTNLISAATEEREYDTGDPWKTYE